MASSDGGEPSLVEYARFHGLAVNHLKHDVHRLLLSDIPTDQTDVELWQFKAPDIEELPAEPKFILDRKAATLLASCIKAPTALRWDYELSDHHRLKRLKLEQPALRTDHQTDMKEIRCRALLETKVTNLSRTEMVEERDEDLAFAAETMGLAAVWDKNCARERLQTTPSGFKALQDAIRPINTIQMHEAIIREQQIFAKFPRADPISLPLLPSEFREEPSAPPSPARSVQDLPDGCTPDRGTQHNINEEIAHQTSVKVRGRTPFHVGQLVESLQLAQHHPASLEVDRCQREVSPKLTSSKLDLLKGPTSSQRLAGDADNSTSPLGNSASQKLRSKRNGLDDDHRSFKHELFAQAANDAVEALGNDPGVKRIEQTDIRMRVLVPMLDSTTGAITKVPSTDTIKRLVEDESTPTWLSFDKTTEMDLGGAPMSYKITDAARKVVEEIIEHPPGLTDLIAIPTLPFQTEDLLWQPDVSRLLKEESDEEELEEDSSIQNEPEIDLGPLLKRKPTTDLAKPCPDWQARSLQVPEMSSTMPAFGSLAGFMDTRKAHKGPRVGLGKKPLEPVETNPQPPAASFLKPIEDIQVPATPPEGPPLDNTLPCALQVPKVASPRTVILRSRLLKSHRRLTQALETRPEPPLTIIYRELDDGDGKDTYTTSPDVIISPTIAAVFTTLQATTQRSLPGQGSTCPHVFTRISALSCHYKRLFVLTTLPPNETSPLSSPSTCSQISTLTSFCVSLSHSKDNVEPLYIPTINAHTSQPLIPVKHDSRQPDPLYTWLLPLILSHGPDLKLITPDQGMTLLAEETLWELFLCKAGMNPYAAQVVLGILKKPAAASDGEEKLELEQSHEQWQSDSGQKSGGGSDNVSSCLWGLRAFVQMSREERMRLFAHVVGSRALERISEVLDAPWGRSITA